MGGGVCMVLVVVLGGEKRGGKGGGGRVSRNRLNTRRLSVEVRVMSVVVGVCHVMVANGCMCMCVHV